MIAILITILLVTTFIIGIAIGKVSGLNEARDILQDTMKKNIIKDNNG